MHPVEISAGRLHLRPWTPYDEEPLVTLFTDPETVRWTPVPVPFTLEEARQRLTELYPQWWADGAGAVWAVVDSVSADVLAWVALFDVADAAAEIGWATLPVARGHGVMSEAVSAVCRWGFAELELERLQAVVKVGNWASLAVAQKCGFRVEGVGRGLMRQRGTRVDAWVAGLLAAEGVEDRRPLRPVELSDGVVRLRTFRPSDASDVARACDDPETARWLPVPVPYTQDDGRAYVEQVAPAGWFDGSSATFAVVDARTGELLGDVSLKLPHRHPLRFGEVGYWTAPWARGGGVASRATRLVAEWGLQHLGLNRVELFADRGNVASRRVAEKAGFTHEGVARRARPRRDGSGADMSLYSLTRDDLR